MRPKLLGNGVNGRASHHMGSMMGEWLGDILVGYKEGKLRNHVKPLECHLSSFCVRSYVGMLNMKQIWNTMRSNMVSIEHEKDSRIRSCVDPTITCIRATMAEQSGASSWFPYLITSCVPSASFITAYLHVKDWRSSLALEEEKKLIPLLLFAPLPRNLALVELNKLSFGEMYGEPTVEHDGVW